MADGNRPGSHDGGGGRDDGRGPDVDTRGPFVVDPVPMHDPRRPGAFAVAFAAIAVLVVGLSAWGLLAPTVPSPPPPAPTAGASSAVAEASPAIASPGPDAARPGPSEDAGLVVLASRAGWADCPLWRGIGQVSPVGPVLVDLERTRLGVTAGRLAIEDDLGATRTVWLGDASAAIRDLGGVRSVREGGVAWTEIAEPGQPEIALELASTTLDDGTVYWQERSRVTPAPYCVHPVEAGTPARVIEVGATEDPLRRLLAELGIDTCRSWQRLETAQYRGGADVDQAIDLARIPPGGSGWVMVPVQPGYGERQVRVWVGDDPAVAGAQHGSDLVVLQPGTGAADAAGSAWMAVMLDGRTAAIELRVVDTPTGRRAWVPTPNLAGTIGSCTTGRPAASVPPEAAEATPAPADQPAVDAPAVELLRGGGDAMAMLEEHFGWTGCRMTTTTGGGTRPAADAIDRAAQATGIEDGWVVLNPDLPRGRVRVWLGDDLVRLARAADVGVVATDGTPEAWLADATRATAWRAIVTADGRTAWYATGALVAPDGPCTSEPRAPDPLAGVRSLTCWIDRARCLEAVAAAMRTAPDAFGPGTDVAATTTGTCPPGARCLLSGPNTPALVTAMNAGVPSPAGLRAFTAGWRRLPVLVRELEPDEIDARVLAAVARPSIALPVSTPDETAASFCPAAGIDGRLHGSPWDPRVAWVGPNTVRWPAGTMALFLPDLVLVAPAGQGYRPGDVLQVSGTAGATAVFVACRITGDASAPLRSVP